MTKIEPSERGTQNHPAVTTVAELGGGIATADGVARPLIPIEPIADGGGKELA